MKKNIILLMLLCLSMITYAVNPIKEGNMISGHVIVKGTEENVPYATVRVVSYNDGAVPEKLRTSGAVLMMRGSLSFVTLLRVNIRCGYKPWAIKTRRRQ